MSIYSFYTTRDIKPEGWLRKQLEIQAEGLSGHLHEVWPDVRDSAWIGGDREGWERVPYWLDGFIPLAFLLEREDLQKTAKKYVDAILQGQKESGWICPCPEEKIPAYDTWALLLISKVLVGWYDSTKDERIPPALYRAMHNFYLLLKENTVHLFDWGAYRWFEGLIAIRFLYEKYPESWLKELAAILKTQGIDYEKLTHKWVRPLNAWQWDTHIVNLAMMLKAEALYNSFMELPMTGFAERMTETLEKYNGTPAGVFTGDECLSGLSPIQGTECCAVVEQMYSMEQLYALTQNPLWAEKLELIAFNALPATLSDDMWAHQYVQMSNQVSCEIFPGKPVFRTNGRDSHLFGLEPNFGCCTANFSQGWPKLALSALLHRENEIHCAVALPCSLHSDKADVRVQTDYPFRNHIVIEIVAKENIVFTFRVPSFAKSLFMNGATVANTALLSVSVHAGEKKTLDISFAAEPRLTERPYGLHTAKMGSLVFSMPISCQKVKKEYEKDGVERKFPYCDWEYVGLSDWNYGFAAERLIPSEHDISSVPFSSECPPLTLMAEMCEVDWPPEDGYDRVCAKIPKDVKALNTNKEVQLYPYGCAKLRMTEMPVVKNDE